MRESKLTMRYILKARLWEVLQESLKKDEKL